MYIIFHSVGSYNGRSFVCMCTETSSVAHIGMGQSSKYYLIMGSWYTLGKCK